MIAPMPIRPENKDRYPKEWKAISRRIRERGGNACEKCYAPNGGMIRRGVSREGVPVWRECGWSAYEDGASADDGSRVPDTGEDTVDWGRPVRVVLTVAHLDHTPENCAPDNLRALCQRCHNVYDAPMRARGIAERKKAQMACRDLLE